MTVRDIFDLAEVWRPDVRYGDAKNDKSRLSHHRLIAKAVNFQIFEPELEGREC